ATGANVFDPQIMWDEQTQRWYYIADYIQSSTQNAIAIGWSKTADPNVPPPGGWCRYIIDTATPFDDFPKLGQSNGFLIVGANVYADNGNGAFQNAIVWTLQKPVAGTTCPATRTLQQFGSAGSPLMTSD